MKVILVLFVLFNFSFSPLFARLTNNLDSGNPLEKLRDEQKDEPNGSITGGTSGIVSESKFAHAGGAGGSGGHSTGEGSHGNSGQANTIPRGGGGAVIPVYAAGQRNNNHHSGSTFISLRGKHGLLLIVVFTILTSPLLHIFM